MGIAQSGQRRGDGGVNAVHMLSQGSIGSSPFGSVAFFALEVSSGWSDKDKALATHLSQRCLHGALCSSQDWALQKLRPFSLPPHTQ